MSGRLLQVHADAVVPQAWRNGGGRTRELLTRPAGDAWQLRISLADVDRDGPFSNFAGTQRWFAVVAGAGVSLRFADTEHLVTMASPALSFDGAAAPQCSLLDGPTRDLNVMVREGTAVMRRVEAAVDWREAFTERGLFTLSAGCLQSERCGELPLPPSTLAWCIGPGACRFSPRAPGPAGWWLGWSPRAAAEES